MFLWFEGGLIIHDGTIFFNRKTAKSTLFAKHSQYNKFVVPSFRYTNNVFNIRQLFNIDNSVFLMFSVYKNSILKISIAIPDV